MPSDLLKHAFPTEWSKIQKARKVDGRLDEACSDFETLAVDLEVAKTNPGVMSDGLMKDFEQSAEALINEITALITQGKTYET